MSTATSDASACPADPIGGPVGPTSTAIPSAVDVGRAPIPVARIGELYAARAAARANTLPVITAALCSAATQPGQSSKRRKLVASDLLEIDELTLHDQLSVALLVVADGGKVEQVYASATPGGRIVASAVAGGRHVGPVYAGDLFGAQRALRDAALDIVEAPHRAREVEPITV